jgi:MIP family channel proteins
MKPLSSRAFAEAIGTFFLCFIGVSAICTVTMSGDKGLAGLVAIALAHGLALGIAITDLGKVSGGHFNPAVSITMVATRQMPAFAGLVYVISQLVGATVAGFAARAGFPAEVYNAAGGGVPVPGAGVSMGTAIFLEAIGTFFLLMAVFGTAVDIKAPSVGGFAIGLTVTFDILAIGPLTGASMNPARTFGPAVAANIWTQHLVYWIGPIIGGVIAGLIYTQFFMTPVEPEKPVGSGID